MGAGLADRVCPLVCGKYFPLLDAHLGGSSAYIIIILLANLVGSGATNVENTCLFWMIEFPFLDKRISFFGWQNFLLWMAKFLILDNKISKKGKFDGLQAFFGD